MRCALTMIALAVPALGGCMKLSYLAQAAAGQDEIAFRARPIAEVVADPSVPARTRELLAMIQDVKSFGERHGLKSTSNYRSYADLKRDAAVWVVTASEPLRFSPLTWRFPIVGAVPYLGWFDKRDAERQAAELRARGYDVELREASAYSTLGWFDDPVLSTMIDGGAPATASASSSGTSAADLVEVVLHESTHATCFVASQAVFNESLANFVAARLTQQYLKERLGGDRWQLFEYQDELRDHDARAKRMHEAYLALSALYAQDLAAADKLRRKATLLDELRRDLSWRGELNNAVLAQAQLYDSGEEALSALLGACGGDFSRFLRALRAIGPGDFPALDETDIDAIIAKATARCS